MDLAMRWLKIRDRSEVELRRKFREKGVEPEQVDATIEKLKGLDLLSDTRFAAGRAGSLVRGGRYGPRAVKAKLSQAGVVRGTVDGAVTEAMSTHNELEMARTALMKKHPLAIGTQDQKLRAKAVRFLLGRGFNANVVSKALQIEIELDRDDEPPMGGDD
jgi:regulatory protein